jgi:hypothetical protein
MEKDLSTDEVIAQFNEAFRQHDISILEPLIDESCIMEAAMPAPNGETTIGKEDCLAFWRQLIDAKGTQFTPEKVIVALENAIIFWRFSWGEGDENSVRGVNIMKVKNGKVTEALGYVKAELRS